MFCRQQHPGPVIGIIECPKLQAIRESVHALDDFPCVTIPCNARDNNYQVRNGSLVITFSCNFSFDVLFCLHLSVQALGWQATAGRTSMQRCAAATQWFNERISLARYAHVRILYCHYSELFQLIWKWLLHFLRETNLYINSYLNRCHWETLNLIGFFLLLMCSSQGHCMTSSRFVFMSSWCN